MPTLEFALVYGLAGFLLIRLMLTLPWPVEVLAKKPWSCPTCLSSWWAVMLSVLQWVRVPAGPILLPEVLAAGGITLLALSLYSWLVPMLPPLPHMDDPE